MNKNIFVMRLLIILIVFVSKYTTAQTTKLDSLFSPIVTAIPPSDAYIGLSLLPSGEIRHYNYGEQALNGTFYIRSLDNGFTWDKISISKEIPQADTQNPITGEYLRVANLGREGVFAIHTEGGLNGGRRLIRITDKPYIMVKPPVFIRGGKRVIVATHPAGGGLPKGALTLYSDDNGTTWKESNQINTPNHTSEGFHKGIRWNHGAVEPTVVELNDGRLWMIIRTPLDKHYQSFSDNGGETWSEPTPSPFYGTITMPTLGRLKDGKLLFLWCNTTPLPELESANGVWDDVFTNRNALHAAISEDDGKTWCGFRELYLDARRNSSDFGSSAGMDKSVHQTQFVEPSEGKLVVSLGQNQLHRKILLFDVNWLKENERYSNFSDSLKCWSTFQYYKGIVGHCGYNRREGGIILPHPEKKGDNILKLTSETSNDFISKNVGAVWNFPAMHNGTFTTSIKMTKKSGKYYLSLSDRWFNPTDSTSKYYSMYSIELDGKTLKIDDNKWHEIKIIWEMNTNKPTANLYIDGRIKQRGLPLVNPSEHGISYVHFISTEEPDEDGLLIEYVKASRQ